jgi:hypothetical protein
VKHFRSLKVAKLYRVTLPKKCSVLAYHLVISLLGMDYEIQPSIAEANNDVFVKVIVWHGRK